MCRRSRDICVYFLCKRGPCITSAFFFAGTFDVVTFFDIEPQKRSRVTKLNPQMQHRVIQWYSQSYPPLGRNSLGSQIACASDIVMVLNNIDQAIFRSTATRIMWLSFVCSSLFIFILCVIFVPSWRRCPLLDTFFVIFLRFFSERFPCLIWFWFRLSCDHGLVRSASVNVRSNTSEHPPD